MTDSTVTDSIHCCWMQTRFTFDVIRAGDTTLRFSARGSSGEAVIEVALEVRASNYRLASNSSVHVRVVSLSSCGR